MDSMDQSRKFLENFPEIASDATFCFACHPEIRCFNSCCSNLTLNLTPYDVYRLRKGLNLSSRDFLSRYGKLVTAPDTGLPSITLLMADESGKSCPFLRPEGCSVYPDRPGACRSYPVGRASAIVDQRPVERFFLIKEPHCKGFEEKREWTPNAWFSDQGLKEYVTWNDRMMLLGSRLRSAGRSISSRNMGMVVLALYNLDDFQTFLEKMQITAKLPLSEADARSILSDEQKTLDFGFKWMDIILFGSDPQTILSQTRGVRHE
ncbi:MAG: YkgJ family cysteine cluster protein [Desulfovibrionales bacterium]